MNFAWVCLWGWKDTTIQFDFFQCSLSLFPFECETKAIKSAKKEREKTLSSATSTNAISHNRIMVVVWCAVFFVLWNAKKQCKKLSAFVINIFFHLAGFSVCMCSEKKNWRWLNKRFGASLQCKVEVMKIDSKTGTNKWPLKIKPHEWPFSLALAQHRSCLYLLHRTGFYPRFSFQSFHKDTLTEAQRHKDRSGSGRLISASPFYLLLLPSTFCTDLVFR